METDVLELVELVLIELLVLLVENEVLELVDEVLVLCDVLEVEVD